MVELNEHVYPADKFGCYCFFFRCNEGRMLNYFLFYELFSFFFLEYDSISM